MRCERVRFYLDALVDGELGQIRRWAVDQHIRGCAACGAELNLARRLTHQAREWRSVDAPPYLKERIAAAVTGTAAELAEHAPPEPVRTRRIVIPRRALVAAVPAALAGIATVVLARRGQADPLRQTLDAMGKVRSARARGYASILAAGHDPVDETRADLEYLYLAPDRYRKVARPGAHRGGLIPGTLFVRRYQGIFIASRPMAPGMEGRIDESDVRADLSHFDLFTSDGLLARAAHDRLAELTQSLQMRDGAQVRIVDVRVEQGGQRRHWVLTTDARTHRVPASEHDLQMHLGGRWVLGVREVLSRFEYDVAIDPGELEPPGTPFPRSGGE